MKKALVTLVCALLVCALLAGCGGGSDSGSAQSGAPAGESAPGSKYSFTLKGVQIAANAEMAPLVEALGEPTDYFESESCAFQGLDKVYTYGSVIIRTYPKDAVDYVLSVELRDDTVSTGEGVYIGASAEDVTAAYGEPSEQSSAALRYVDGDCTLTFLLTDGRVTDITYTSDAA